MPSPRFSNEETSPRVCQPACGSAVCARAATNGQITNTRVIEIDFRETVRRCMEAAFARLSLTSCLQRANHMQARLAMPFSRRACVEMFVSSWWNLSSYKKVLDKHKTIRAHCVHSWAQYRFSSWRILPCLKW